MAKSRMVDPRMWSDGWFRRLNALDRYAFIYFLTNEHSSWCGVYELDISMAAFESGIDERDLEKSILPRLSPKIVFIDGWVYVKNWEKYHSNESPQTKKGIELAWKEVPEEIRLRIDEICNKEIPPAYPIEGASSSASASASASAPMVGDASVASPPPPRIGSSLSEKKPRTPREFTNARRAEKGKPPLSTPRTEKQVSTFDALRWKTYFRDHGKEQHGMQFFLVNSKKREDTVTKLMTDAKKAIPDLDFKGLIDWWFENGWGGYEPELCFMGKTIEQFLNRGKGNKGDKKMTEDEIYEALKSIR